MVHVLLDIMFAVSSLFRFRACNTQRLPAEAGIQYGSADWT